MKNYFYFSKSQKTGILVLLVILAVILVVNESLPYLLEDKEAVVFKTEAIPVREPDIQQITTQTLVAFDPNTLDSTGFISLGIKPAVVGTILKYRQKGGRFDTPQDFSKIYGLSEEQFLQLLPYISISSKESIKTKQEKTVLRIDLNSCDTTDLQKLKGIGPVFANRIVKYRALLGGFVQKEQLKEVYGLSAETYDEIVHFIHIDTKGIKKIAINNVSVAKLGKHPYLNTQTANAICEQRKKLGKLTSENDLTDAENLPAETLQKILPYISFE